jgi:hypothetical protein
VKLRVQRTVQIFPLPRSLEEHQRRSNFDLPDQSRLSYPGEPTIRTFFRCRWSSSSTPNSFSRPVKGEEICGRSSILSLEVRTPHHKARALCTRGQWSKVCSGKAQTRTQRAELCFLQDTQLSERCDTVVQPVLLDDLAVHDLEDRYAGESHFSTCIRR